MQIVDESGRPPESSYGQNKLRAIGVMVAIVGGTIMAIILGLAIYIATF